MSLLIKGMEMPSRCFACPMCDVDCCGISHASYIEYREVDVDTAMNGRPDWCPLAPIPPHGDLIDKSDLMKLFQDEERYGYIDALDIVVLPTIIEAEEGE